MFPNPGAPSLVVAKGIQAGDEKPAGAVRPQAGVDFEEPAGRGLGIQEGHQPLGQARIDLARRAEPGGLRGEGNEEGQRQRMAVGAPAAQQA